MPLSLYRRHRRECKSGHFEDLLTSEFEERKKTWKRCDCPIIVSGTLNRKFGRKTTGQWEWAQARAVAQQWEAARSWEGPAPASGGGLQQTAPPLTKERFAIADAAEAFFAKCQNRGIQPSTLAKYRTFNIQLRAFSSSKGYVYLDQLTVADMDIFFASWKDGIRAKAKKLDRLKSFVKFCMKRKWLTEDITEDLQAPEGSSLTVPKSPYTDEEMARIYAACGQINAPPRPGGRNWTGEDARDFIDLSIYTGLRISDVATFDITKRLKGNDVFLRMHKTGKPLFTWIPDWLVARLVARQQAHGSLIFKCGVTHNVKQLTDIWRGKRLSTVFAFAAPWEERPHPHRFRHTFVRILLEKGVPTADVAELIGDTEETLIKHYSKWIKTRQARLSNILRTAFQERERSKVVSISSGRIE